TTKLTPSQPIQSASSETIIDIDSTSTPLESNNLNTKTSQTIYNISTSTIEIEQDQTTTFYSVSPSPVQILDSRSATVSPIIPPTLYNISSTPPNISLLTTVNRNIEQSSSSSYTPLYPQLDTILSTTYTTDYNIETSYQPNIEQSLLYLQFDGATWDTLHPDNYNTETQYTSIYPNISDTEETTQTSLNNQLDSDSEQSFGKAYTAILNQVQTLNNNTDNQDLSSNYPISDEESNSSDSETEMDDAARALTLDLEIEAKAEIEIILRSVVDPGTEVKNDINKLTLPNDPGEGSSSSFTITTEVLNQPIEDIKEKQPQYDTEMPIENNKILQQIIERLEAR
ncbi:41520_t:CDS:2, partial [Gigaspora margarita]